MTVNTATPFRIAIPELVGSPGKRREVDIDAEVEWGMEAGRVERVVASLVLESATGGVVVRGPVVGTVHHTCHRCLNEWDDALELEMTEVLGVEDEEEGYPIEDGVADLEQPLRDVLLLAVPLAPTCRPDCLGLCSTCGADLNTGACSGHDEEPDSPFASLRGLLDT